MCAVAWMGPNWVARLRKRVEGKKELLFVNKKKQKNFISFRAGRFQHRAKRNKKVFCFFFSKKKRFLAYGGTHIMQPADWT
jgi:hypothetical protein